MKQITALIRYDLLMQLRERGTLLLLAAALLLAGFGLFEGSRFERQGQAARADAARQEADARSRAGLLAERYFAQPDAPEFAGLQWFRTPVDIRGYAFREHVGFAAKPGVPGAALGIAQADILPAYVRVRAESMESVRTAAEIEHPGRLAAGRYDLMFFVVYLWPLILLSLCMSVLTQDRESRRLRSLQLQGVSPLRLLLVQIGARALAATLALLLFCVVAALAIGAVPATAAGLAALASWSAIVLLYSAFWSAVAAAICAACASRMSAAFAVSGAWLVFAIVIPGALTAGV
jgi:ABC-2 type transport system permease protein